MLLDPKVAPEVVRALDSLLDLQTKVCETFDPPLEVSEAAAIWLDSFRATLAQHLTGEQPAPITVTIASQPIHRIAVTQVVRVVRRTIVSVAAPTPEAALELQQDELPAPNYDAPVWTEYPDLQDESCRIATDRDEEDLAARTSGALDAPETLKRKQGGR